MKYVDQPVITDLLGKRLHEASQVSKPTALGTPLRYSAAHSCERQQGYAAFDAQPTEPVDFAGAWVMGMGTMVHEALQEVILETFPGAICELSSGHNEAISGSCDAYIPAESFGEGWTGGNVLYELKTMGTYSFDQQVGWNRQRASFGTVQGPALKAITQAGLNALGIEAKLGITIDTIIMGSITFEALSKQKAQRMGVADAQRVMAEFWITRDEWEPMANTEIERMGKIYDDLQQGFLGDRVAINDDGLAKMLNPEGSDWNCAYCAFRQTCVQDGPGVLWVNDSVFIRKGQ
jgi:hypothetical protein